MPRIISVFLLVVLLVVGAGALAATMPQPSQVVSDRLVVEVARRVLWKTDPEFSQRKLNETSVKVRAFIENMGGEAWYRNYLRRFGYPQNPAENMTPALVDLHGEQLGVYYIHPPRISSETMTGVICNLEKMNISLHALCALENRNAAMMFNDAQALEKFHELARWLLANQRDGRFEWTTDFPERDQKAPWISALTQSFSISVMLREYQFDHDPAFLDAATKALAWLRKPVQQGGIAWRMRKGVWYEEYPSAGNPSHVLNGHMWALFGIWDYYRATGSKIARQMFDDGITALRAELDKYDVGYWSVYAQTNRVDMVTGQYMQFIVGQLRVLYAITEIQRFKKVADRWERAQQQDLLFAHNAAVEYLKANPVAKDARDSNAQVRRSR